MIIKYIWKIKKPINGNATNATATEHIIVIMTMFTSEPFFEMKKIITLKKKEIIDKTTHPKKNAKNL